MEFFFEKCFWKKVFGGKHALWKKSFGKKIL